MEVESVRTGRSQSNGSRLASSGPTGGRTKQQIYAAARRQKRGGTVGGHYDRQAVRGLQWREGSGIDTDTDTDIRSVSVSFRPTPAFRGEEQKSGNYAGAMCEQDQEDWPDTTTVVTGATSELAFSTRGDADLLPLAKDLEESIGFSCCARYACFALTAVLGSVAFVSPVVMVVMPKVGLPKWETVDECRTACEGLLISFAFKLLILLVGSWALFLRRPASTLPRICAFRALVLFLIFISSFAFWLFYGVRIYLTAETDYYRIVQFGVSFVDALLFIHYFAVILLELRQLKPQYALKITRSPDGLSGQYLLGQMSIQRCAVWCLERYYRDFSVYNPYLESRFRRRDKCPKTGGSESGFKIYEVDRLLGSTGEEVGAGNEGSLNAVGGGQRQRVEKASGSTSGHNSRFYEEEDYERHVKKRRARLLVAAEESFHLVKRLQQDAKNKGVSKEMTSGEAAQSIFPTLMRPLKKYLRATRQQPFYSMESIVKHLALCLSNDMSPKAFLERYLQPTAVVWNDRDSRSTDKWTLACDKLVSCGIADGTVFRLSQGDVSLLMTMRKLPHCNLTEEATVSKNDKFVLSLSSETPV